ncbi:ABC-type amino acid transport/signal transduction system, periplasmic component/domain [Lactococcus lactis subsp. lactis IO-1]|nr:ABC-type amino acid transport/signal transduction system, periplasmic component/domain [Lactococcus lactis subsp. lactis IO-1]
MALFMYAFLVVVLSWLRNWFIFVMFSLK